MAKFYFDFFDGTKAIIDAYGDDFLEIEDAAEQASALLIDFAREEIPNGTAKDFGVVVRNDDDSSAYRAALVFRDAYVDPEYPGNFYAASSISVPDPMSVIRQSQEARQRSKEVFDLMQAKIQSLGDVITQSKDAQRQREYDRLRDGEGHVSVPLRLPPRAA